MQRGIKTIPNFPIDMLFLQFALHQARQAMRSSIWQKSVALNVLIGFFAFIILAQFTFMSVILAKNWHEIVKEDNVLFDFYKVMAWYFAAMFVFRFFMQQMPVLAIEPYRHLPIKKSSLVHFVLTKAAFDFFSLLALVFFIPFAIYQVDYYHGPVLALLWLLAVLVIDLTLNYLVLYFKKQLVSNIKVVLGLLATIAVLVIGDIYEWYSYSKVFAGLFSLMIEHPILLLLPALLLFVVYRLNFVFLKKQLYIEENIRVKESVAGGAKLGYLERFGMIGEILGLDVRLFLRNKRTKTMLYMTPVFLLYGLFFYASPTYSETDGFMVFVGIFMTGGVLFNYLQYAFAYEGVYFDMLLTSRVDFRDYIRAKFLGGSILVIASFILIIPYAYYGWFILLINTATFLFNLGIVLPMLVFIATYNTKAMDLSKGTAFNFQGVGATHYMTMIPVFVMPLFLYLPFKWFGDPMHGVILIGITGLLGLALRRFFIRIIWNNFNERKYIMANGFRQKD